MTTFSHPSSRRITRLLAAPATHRGLLLMALLVALLTRLHHLGGESLWYDETVSVVLARKPVTALIEHTARDIHPPGYYLMLRGWQQLTHPTLQHGLEFLFAWPSLLFGMLIVALLYPVGRRLFNPTVGLLAAWIAAIHPQHIWYSQEVRMYTLGAFLGLLCLWMLLQYANNTDRQRARRYLLGYAICAALGLYTLYYFLFTLAALNGIALILLWYAPTPVSDSQDGRVTRLGWWIAAQFGALLLWLPWIPIFWRQATEPPVPPWRAPWTTPGEGINALAESVRTLLLGESFPSGNAWFWLALGGLLLFAAYRYTKQHPEAHTAAWLTPILYLFIPLASIMLLSWWLTPLYHVRYLFTYAPPFALLMAAGLLYLWRNRWLGVVALLLLLIASGWSLQRFWHAPAYRADDHRNAVAEVARQWRPGDAILANAGWIYTVLDVYWPTQPDPLDAAPPPIYAMPRLSAYLDPSTPPPDATNAPIVVRTGSVDGDDMLGWGHAESDFYAISRAESERAIAAMTQSHPRIWHYRLYDTVNDPDGVIRSALLNSTTLAQDVGYPGRDYLRVQRFDTDAAAPHFATEHADAVSFGEAVNLSVHVAPERHRAGEMLYVDLYWEPLDANAQSAANLQTSLRLYDSAGQLLTQADAPLAQGDSLGMQRTPLALPVPLAAAPGSYSLELVIYQAADGAPLSLPAHTRTVDGQRWRLNGVDIDPADDVPIIPTVQARFDYIDLVSGALDRGTAAPGNVITAHLLWRPRPNEYQDSYNAIIELRTDDGAVAARWASPAGGDRYPSGEWLPLHPVRDLKTLTLPTDLASGRYEVTLRLERASDGLPIATRRGLWPLPRESAPLGTLTVQP